MYISKRVLPGRHATLEFSIEILEKPESIPTLEVEEAADFITDWVLKSVLAFDFNQRMANAHRSSGLQNHGPYRIADVVEKKGYKIRQEVQLTSKAGSYESVERTAEDVFGALADTCTFVYALADEESFEDGHSCLFCDPSASNDASASPVILLIQNPN